MNEEEQVKRLLLAELSASLAGIHNTSGRFLGDDWQTIDLKDTISALRAIHEECENVLPVLKEIVSKSPYIRSDFI